MTLTLQEISDRLEIQELLARYCQAIDGHDWEALDSVFTPAAVIDYSEFGGPRAELSGIKSFLAEVMPLHSGHYHLVSNVIAEVDGDRATCRSVCNNPMVLDKGDGRTHVYFCGLWYEDELVRTDAGWRISARREQKCFLWDPEATPRR